MAADDHHRDGGSSEFSLSMRSSSVGGVTTSFASHPTDPARRSMAQTDRKKAASSKWLPCPICLKGPQDLEQVTWFNLVVDGGCLFVCLGLGLVLGTM